MNRTKTPTVVSVFGVDPLRVGGTETFARELSLQLQASGWQSVLCFLRNPEGAVKSHLLLPNVSLHEIERSWAWAYKPTAQLIHVLRLYHPSVLHLHFTGLVSPYPWVASVCAGCSVFVTDHASRPADFVPKEANLPKRLVGRVLNRPIEFVVSVSDYNRRCLEKTGFVRPGGTVVVYNGVDLERTRVDEAVGREFRRRWAIPEDRLLLVQVSWLIPEKGVPDLLAAMRLLLRQGVRVHLAVVGDGPCRKTFERQAAEMEIAEAVSWTGIVTDPFGEGVYRAADICCQVSRWQEAFGWTIAEAMATGKPVIGTAVGGIPELLRHGETGYLVPPQDPAAIAAAASTLASDAGLRRRVGEAARLDATVRFDVRHTVARLMELYRIHTGERTSEGHPDDRGRGMVAR